MSIPIVIIMLKSVIIDEGIVLWKDVSNEYSEPPNYLLLSRNDRYIKLGVPYRILEVTEFLVQVLSSIK